MEKEIKEFMEKLNAAGYAVAVFTPAEIGDASIEEVEDRMIMAGWDAIHDAEDESEDEEV